ncbi:hypothetical protein D3C79_1005390 [compost metagenome]
MTDYWLLLEGDPERTQLPDLVYAYIDPKQDHYRSKDLVYHAACFIRFHSSNYLHCGIYYF